MTRGRLLLDQLKPPRISNPDPRITCRRQDRPMSDEPALSEKLGRGACRRRAALCVEHARSVGDVVRQYREAGQRDSGTGAGRSALRLSSATKVDKIVDVIRAHLHEARFSMVEVRLRKALPRREPIR